MKDFDAVVVGSGPNGLAAAITIAEAGYAVKIFEAKDKIGGGLRSAEFTSPGFIHDVCSAIHPFMDSPFFENHPLNKNGLEWIYPSIPLAHPFDNGSAAVLRRSVYETAESLKEDAENYIKVIKPLLDKWDLYKNNILSPFNFFPKHPLALSRFGLYAIQSAEMFGKKQFSSPLAKSLFAGAAGHSMLPLNKYITSEFGLVLILLAHKTGWPFPKGGSQRIADALSFHLKSIGAEIEAGHKINSIYELPPSKAILFDLTPKQLLNILGDKIPLRYKKKLEAYKYGPGVFKMDWALNSSIPFKSGECRNVGVVHLGGTFEEILRSEYQVSIGKIPEKPFIILAQQTIFDNTRTPEGKHTAWAYCHVPNNSKFNMTDRIENQIERFAPGFKDIIISKHSISAHEMENYNANYIGGDINGGMQNLGQFFTRPSAKLNPYSLPIKGLYICSSSTPPGGGVHGMCGYNAALKAIKFLNHL